MKIFLEYLKLAAIFFTLWFLAFFYGVSRSSAACYSDTGKSHQCSIEETFQFILNMEPAELGFGLLMGFVISTILTLLIAFKLEWVKIPIKF